MDYDILIVGAGLAGLHSALRLSKKNPKAKIAIAEAYHYIGGRVVSYRPKGFKGIQWENGAGRIHSSHTLLLHYIKKYGLTLIPLSEDQIFIDSVSKEVTKSKWGKHSELLYKILTQLSDSVLESHTIYQILTKVFTTEFAKEISYEFPYYSELYTMNARSALESIHSELGSNSGFFVVKEGLSTLIDCLVSELKSKNITFLMGHKLYKVNEQSCMFHVKEEKDDLPIQKVLKAKKIILALHSEALKQISPFTNYPVLKKIKMEPLLRIYAIFKNSDWFSDLPKIVTNSPLRFIIPMSSSAESLEHSSVAPQPSSSPKTGVIMISYTDGKDTEYWMKHLDKGNDHLQKQIMKQIRLLLPDRKIPEPIYLKAHPWYEGCSYWIPGHPRQGSPEVLSEKIMKPFDRWDSVFVCGESFSANKQCWMEGALEHSEKMLERYFGM